MDVNIAETLRKKFNLYTGAFYGKSVDTAKFPIINSIIETARAAYFSGDTHAKFPDEMPEVIDGREDKSKPWMRI